MRVCGIDLKANNMIFSVVDCEDDIVTYIDMKIKKISLEDDEKRDDIISFSKKVYAFLYDNKIEKVVIKKRAKKGNFSGGAITFKMEGIMQLNTLCKVELISSQAVSSYERKNEINLPKELKKYQEASYLTALTSL